MKHFALMALWLLAMPMAQAAGFDCRNATATLERAVCWDPALSQADSEMRDSYAFLLAKCPDVAMHADLVTTQAHWEDTARAAYGKGGPLSKNLLLVAYRERNAALDKLVATCANASLGRVQATVQIVADTGGFELPFVSTSPPAPGWYINRQIIGVTDDPSALLDASALRAFLAAQPRQGTEKESQKYDIVRNSGRLLVLQLDRVRCDGRCFRVVTQQIFDLRTGRRVQPSDLFTDVGALTLGQKLNDSRVSRGESAFAAAKDTLSDKDLAAYYGCLQGWKQTPPAVWPMHLLADGRWEFQSDNCDTNFDPAATLLDGFNHAFSLVELRPYLSAYGRSVLLNENDVREPHADATPECRKTRGLAVHRNDREPTPEIQVAAGPSHFLLLTPDGKLWGWGESQEGELGSARGYHDVPVFLGAGYAQAGGGEFYTAARKRDGTLWTWGSNYLNRLGAATLESSRLPVRIGEHFVSLNVESDGGMALKGDGTVWEWGGKIKAPQQMMANVAQIEYGPPGERLILTKDGSLWAFGGKNLSEQTPYDEARPRLIGKGFTRIPVRRGDLAFKADGSLWAWGVLLADTLHQPGQVSFDDPVNIGSGFVDVQVSTTQLPYLAALKADGTLWLPMTRGDVTQMEPVDCGYADVVAGNEYLLALKQDGTLELSYDWDLKTLGGQKPNDELPPLPGHAHRVQLDSGYTRLIQLGDVTGSGGTRAIALRRDGTVWLFDPPWPRTQDWPRAWFRQVPFPKESRIGM